MADDNFQDPVRAALREHDGYVFRRNWVWTPKRCGMGYYGRVNHYPIPVATVGDTDRKPAPQDTLFHIEHGRDTEYMTGKPPDLYRKLVPPPILETGERLLEPFCGGAPGSLVASSRGLKYWGCDIDEEAVEFARSRHEQRQLTEW